MPEPASNWQPGSVMCHGQPGLINNNRHWRLRKIRSLDRACPEQHPKRASMLYADWSILPFVLIHLYDVPYDHTNKDNLKPQCYPWPDRRHHQLDRTAYKGVV